MPILPKKVFQALGQIAKQTGEAIVKEPIEVLKTAGTQTGLKSGGDKGIEQPQTGGPTNQQLAQVKKKQEEDRKKVEFYRRRLRELAARQPSEPSVSEEELAQEELTEREKAEEKGGLIVAPGKGSKRGTALMGRRKRGKGSGEMVAPKRSK